MKSRDSLNEPVPTYGTLPPNADPQLQGSLQAMRRAAQRARQLAQQTGTDLIVQRSGLVVRVRPEPVTK